jgi:hypothetical protein
MIDMANLNIIMFIKEQKPLGLQNPRHCRGFCSPKGGDYE